MLTQDELVALYRRRARRYDFTANLYYLLGFREWAYRRKAVRALGLSRGDTVVEIGCGTGLNFGLLRKRVGKAGKIIGVDLTDAMLEVAKERGKEQMWSNVELIECDAGEYEFPTQVDGIISTFALTLSPQYDEIIRHGVRALRPGGRWVVADLKMPENGIRHMYPLFLPLFRPFGVTLDLASRHPWESIEKHLGNLSMEHYFLGFTYIAWGEKNATVN